jgi:hypothetical protein
MGHLEPWLCLLVVLTPLWIFLAVFFVLRPLLKWDDERRRRNRQREGFEVKTTTGGAERPVLREREIDHG